jgi:hypothetical protein
MAVKKIIKRILMILASLLVFVMFMAISLTGLAWLALQTPWAQNRITQEVLAYASQQTDHRIDIRKVRIRWFNEIQIMDLMVRDYQNKPLLVVGDMGVNYDLVRLYQTRELKLEHIYLSDGGINLVRYSDSTELNLNTFIRSLDVFRKEKITDSTEAKPIFLKSIIMENFRVAINDLSRERDKTKFDGAHINFRVRLGELGNVDIRPDTISLNLVEFSGADTLNRLFVQKLSSDVQFTTKSLTLSNFSFRTQESHIGDSIRLDYPNPAALNSFMDSVRFYVRLKKSYLSPADLHAFSGSDALARTTSIDGLVHGMVGDLRLENVALGTGKSKVGISAMLIGLPNMKETFLDMHVDNTKLYLEDVRPYTGKSIDGIKSEWIGMRAMLSGFLNDFGTKGVFTTPEGIIKADMNLKIPEKAKDETSYTGHLELENLHVGKLIGDPDLVQEVNLKGRILGKGITREKAAFLGDITTTGETSIKHYKYDSMAFKGYLAARYFFGQFAVVDPNCKISGRLNIDLRAKPERISVTSKIDTLFTKRLNLTEQDLFISSRINWNQRGIQIDSITGTLKVNDLVFKRDSVNTLKLKEIAIDTKVDSTGRRDIVMEIPGIKARLDGEYTFTRLGRFLRDEVGDLISYFDLDEVKTLHEVEPLRARLKMQLIDINEYVHFFTKDLDFAENGELELTMDQKAASDAMVSLFVRFDSVRVNEQKFYNNTVDAFASMDRFSDDILASVNIASAEQHWSGIPHTERLMMEAVWENNRINLRTWVQQPDTDTRIRFHNEILLSKDTIAVQFKPSEIIALGDLWAIDRQNQIWYTKEGLTLLGITLKSGPKSVSVSGFLSDSLKSRLSLNVQNIDLMQMSSETGVPVQGLLSANFKVEKEPDKSIFFDGDFILRDFIYKDFLIGDLRGTAYWDDLIEGIRTKVTVDRENVETISLDGHYFPNSKTEQLDFRLAFDHADFKILEVFTADNLSNLKGFANGNIRINGTLDKPELDGYCDISEGRMKVNYLGVTYNFGGRIAFLKERIDFSDFELYDLEGDKAVFSGNIRHKHFDQITTDLQIIATNFAFLNTTALDNDIFYGRAEITTKESRSRRDSHISVTGPFSDLVIKVAARTERGTRLFIPIKDSEEYEQADFIMFRNLTDTSTLKGIAEKVKSDLGLTLDFDLEITPDAYCELIFNIKTGDIIRGRGRGNLKLKMDKNGNFELFGPLEITEGAYNFTVNIINKEFIVIPGGTITWYGDPYSAEINMQATYLQRTSFAGLSNTQSQDAAMNQRYPVIIVLILKGEMLAPEISFDIRLDESVAVVSSEISSILSQIRSNEQELKRQVVSLMFMKRFAPIGGGFLTAQGSIGQSLSEFLTNQMSYLASQVDENLEIEVDLGRMDENAYNTFQLRLGYTFMDGRLKVTRGGDFSGSTANHANQAGKMNDIIGDWSVEYLLTRDGRLRAKMFSQANRRLTANAGNQNMETGLSLRYIRSFNSFEELLRKAREQAVQRKDEENMNGKENDENIDESSD